MSVKVTLNEVLNALPSKLMAIDERRNVYTAVSITADKDSLLIGDRLKCLIFDMEQQVKINFQYSSVEMVDSNDNVYYMQFYPFDNKPIHLQNIKCKQPVSLFEFRDF